MTLAAILSDEIPVDHGDSEEGKVNTFTPDSR